MTHVSCDTAWHEIASVRTVGFVRWHRHQMTMHLTTADGWEHLVRQEAMTRGQQSGLYMTMCAVVVEPASLVEPPGRPCPRCFPSKL